jgi:hypothetical protein
VQTVDSNVPQKLDSFLMFFLELIYAQLDAAKVIAVLTELPNASFKAVV